MPPPRRIVPPGWVAGVIAITAVASAAGSRYENNFGGVGQSGQVSSVLARRFPAQAGDAAQVVFHSSGPIGFPSVTARVDQALAALRPLLSVASVSPLVTARDGRTALSTVQFDALSAKIPARRRQGGDRQGRVLHGAGACRSPWAAHRSAPGLPGAGFERRDRDQLNQRPGRVFSTS